MMLLPLASIYSDRMEDGAMSICYKEDVVMLFQNTLSLTLGITIVEVLTQHFAIGRRVGQIGT